MEKEGRDGKGRKRKGENKRRKGKREEKVVTIPLWFSSLCWSYDAIRVNDATSLGLGSFIKS